MTFPLRMFSMKINTIVTSWYRGQLICLVEISYTYEKKAQYKCISISVIFSRQNLVHQTLIPYIAITSTRVILMCKCFPGPIWLNGPTFSTLHQHRETVSNRVYGSSWFTNRPITGLILWHTYALRPVWVPYENISLAGRSGNGLYGFAPLRLHESRARLYQTRSGRAGLMADTGG